MNPKDFLYKVVRTFVYPVFSSLYKIRVEGRENIPNGRAILVPNHTSYLDSLYIIAGLNEKEPIHFCTLDFCCHKKGFVNYLVDSFLRATGQIVLENGGLNKTGLKRIEEILGMERKLGIFAEGRRSYNPELDEFRNGASFIALRTNTPLVPVYIEGSYEIWPRARLFPRLSGEVMLKIGMAVHPPRDLARNEKRKRVIQELSDAVRSEIARLAS